MPNPQRNWTINDDVALPSGDRDQQYRLALFALKEAIRQAGGGASGIESSDGNATAGVGDNWPNASAITLNLLSDPNKTWWTAQLGVNAGGSTLYVRLATNDNAGTPQVYEIRIATQPYTGGNLTTLPTTAGTETVMNTSGDNLIPWGAGPVAGRYATWHNTEGDFAIAVKIEGDPYFRQGLLFQAFRDADGGGKGDNRFGLWTRDNAAAASVWTLANFNSALNWEVIESGGSNVRDAEAHSTIQNITSWTNGLDFQGELVDDVLNLYSDQTAVNGGRFIGQLVDWFATETGVAFGTLDDSETAQAQRRIVMGDNSGIIGYFNSASLPLT